MPIFNTLGHAFAWVLKKIVPGAATAVRDAQTVEAVIESPIAQSIASFVGPKGEQVKDDVFSVTGALVKAASDIGVAALAKGLNIQDDEIAVASLERLVSTVGGLFGKSPAAAAPAAQ